MEIKILSYDFMKNLSSGKKIKEILNLVLKNEIVLLEGKLSFEEQNDLTTHALRKINSKFSGIEIAYLSPTNDTFKEKILNKILNLFAKNRLGLTLIGPSKIVKEIKMDPKKLDILLKK